MFGGLKKVGGLLKNVAPEIAKGLLGSNPLGSIAVRAAEKGLKKAFGIPDEVETDPEELATRVKNMNPQELSLLLDQEAEMAKIQLQREQNARKDRQGAREFQKKTSSSFPAWLAASYVLTYVLVAGASLFMLAQYPDPSPGFELLVGTIIGHAAATFKDVAGFYFGASANGEEKSAVGRKDD